ncbi:MAG: alanine--tRNA ligase, partial [Candidatus Buchananbacteria bacterium]|nr:alanine--tRNA ligase [Candidatus Buchananbacteria bacterium]
VAADDEIVKQGIRIIPLDMVENFWIAGASGPCGGDTEMFYDTRPEEGPLNGKFDDYVNNFRLIEIWNDVFMEFNKKPDGTVEKLDQQNIDTGMGVERAITVLNGYANVFETELFTPLLNEIAKISNKKYKENQQAFRIIADHIKAATMILGDDNAVTPSNVDQGYILRRLIRRAVRYGKKLGINELFTFKIAEMVIEMYKETYPEVKKNQDFIINQLIQEEEKFSKTLEKGEKEFQRMIKDEKLSGKEAFILFSTYGFPLELTQELADEKNIKINIEEFNQEMKKHQELSRKGAQQKFKGGLASQDEQTAKLHTATHLLLQALREVLGPQVMQKGSNITADRLRFDFNHDEKLTDEQKQQVEEIVNAKIKENLPITYEEMTVEQAKEKGAIGAFEDRYGDKVKVYSIGDFSKEICGGPHAKNTGELGHLKIKKEESSSAGIRRIKAVLD